MARVRWVRWRALSLLLVHLLIAAHLPRLTNKILIGRHNKD